MTENYENCKYMEMTLRELNMYMDSMIGEYSIELEQKTFPDRRQTSYKEAVKYTATLIWNEYNTKQVNDPDRGIVNKDVLDAVLLSLHPKELVKEKEVSAITKQALSVVEKFRELILLNDDTEKNAQIHAWVRANHEEIAKSFPAQMCLMAWFLTLVSKMTGFKIPNAEKILVGGRIQKETKEKLVLIMSMFTLVIYVVYGNMDFLDKMDFFQYKILNVMREDLNKMVIKYFG